MTVKDLLILLQFYPENAEVFLKTANGRLEVPDEFDELNTESQATLIVSLKEVQKDLQLVL